MSSNPERASGTRWRYQPVFRDDPAGRAITLCECYFDDAGRLSLWTESADCYPQGETTEELATDLARMLADTYKWRAVAFDDLHIGMIFEPTGVDVNVMLDAMNAARNVKQ